MRLNFLRFPKLNTTDGFKAIDLSSFQEVSLNALCHLTGVCFKSFDPTEIQNFMLAADVEPTWFSYFAKQKLTERWRAYFTKKFFFSFCLFWY